MRQAVRLVTPIRLGRLTTFIRIGRAGVSVHWSVLLIAAVILLNAVRHPLLSIVGLAAYLGVLLIHELGHLLIAQRRGYEVFDIELYPVYGITRFQTPWSRFDHCVIAWGGVLAQLSVAVPLIAWVAIFGYTPFDAINAVLAILGFFSLGVVLLNLLPFAPLDGSIAWGIVPALFSRVRRAQSKPQNERGSWR